MSAGRAAGAVTLLLIWTVLGIVIWPLVREHLRQRRAAQRKTLFDRLIPERSWHRDVTPSVRVLPSKTAAASSHPPLVAAPAHIPAQRRIS